MGTQLSKNELILVNQPRSLLPLPRIYVRFRANGSHTPAGADSAYRRSLYRGFRALPVYLFSEAVPPTRRRASAFPLACDTKLCK